MGALSARVGDRPLAGDIDQGRTISAQASPFLD